MKGVVGADLVAKVEKGTHMTPEFAEQVAEFIAERGAIRLDHINQAIKAEVFVLSAPLGGGVEQPEDRQRDIVRRRRWKVPKTMQPKRFSKSMR